MSPDAVNRRLDIVDELREFALELRDSTRLGPIEKPVMTAATSDNKHRKPVALVALRR
jgi:hypothetical protein